MQHTPNTGQHDASPEWYTQCQRIYRPSLQLKIGAELQPCQQTFIVLDPANQQPIARVSDADTEQVEQAIVVALRAQSDWQQQTATARARVLQAWYQAVLSAAPALAHLLSREQGKPFQEAVAEIQYAAAFIQWFAEEARRSYGEMIPTSHPQRRLFNLKQPVGVVAAITPWNFPAAMVTRKIAPALAAGCAVLLKPSELTPLTALAFADLAHNVGIPAEVFQVLPTSKPNHVGQLLCQHPQIRKMTFTGSTAVGKVLLQQCATTVKRVSMELGGNAPMLIFADADLTLAIAGVMAAKFRNAGQTCVSINRIYVEALVYDEFCQCLASAVAKLVVGPASDPATEIGPLITPAAAMRVANLVDDAIQKGARRIQGRQWQPEDGGFYPPTVLGDVNATMAITQQEIFGPVAVVQSFQSETEVLAAANATEAGLAAYLYTDNQQRIWRCTEALQAGMIGVNETAISSELIPFGGCKQSGLGREGSSYGLDEYLEIKHVCWGIR